jgi:hypothetical protein
VRNPAKTIQPRGLQSIARAVETRWRPSLVFRWNHSRSLRRSEARILWGETSHRVPPLFVSPTQRREETTRGRPSACAHRSRALSPGRHGARRRSWARTRSPRIRCRHHVRPCGEGAGAIRLGGLQLARASVVTPHRARRCRGESEASCLQRCGPRRNVGPSR